MIIYGQSRMKTLAQNAHLPTSKLCFFTRVFKRPSRIADHSSCMANWAVSWWIGHREKSFARRGDPYQKAGFAILT